MTWIIDRKDDQKYVGDGDRPVNWEQWVALHAGKSVEIDGETLTIDDGPFYVPHEGLAEGDEAEFAISKADFMRLLRGEMLTYGHLRRTLALRDGPFVILDEDSPVQRLKAPTPPEFVKVGDTPAGIKAEIEAKADSISIHDPTLRDRIRTVLKSFVDGVYKLVGRGGEGSGHFEHEGRPGEVGGSQPSGATTAVAESERTATLPDGEVVTFDVRAENALDEWRRKYPDILDDAVEAAENYSPSRGFAAGAGRFTRMGSMALDVHFLQGWNKFFITPAGDVLLVKDHDNVGDAVSDLIEADYRNEYDELSTASGGITRWGKESMTILGFVRGSFDAVREGPDKAKVTVLDLQFNTPLTSETKATISDLMKINPEANFIYDVNFYKDKTRISGDEDRNLKALINRGGEGSGHFEHEGRPGEVGGSQPGEGAPKGKIGLTFETWQKQPFDESLAASYADAIEEGYGLTPPDKITNATWIAPDGRLLTKGSIHEETSDHALSVVDGVDADDFTISETQVIQAGLIRHTFWAYGKEVFVISGTDTLTREQKTMLRSILDSRVDQVASVRIPSGRDTELVGVKMFVVEDVPPSLDPISRPLDQISGADMMRLLSLKRSEWRTSKIDEGLVVSTAPRILQSGELITETKPDDSCDHEHMLWNGDPTLTHRREKIESKYNEAVEVRGSLRRIFVEAARPKRSKCMECDKKPVVAAHWANGYGMAWFCFDDFKKWVDEEDRDIVGVWVLKFGECPKDIRKNPPGTEKVRKLGEKISISEINSRIKDLIERGGKGSGHFEHEGREGKIGGSLPSGAAKAKKEPRPDRPKPEGEPPVEGEEAPPVEGEEVPSVEGEEVEAGDGARQAEVQSLAGDRVSEAQGYEPELTSTMSNLAEQFGGEMAGLEFSVKSDASLARKIRADMIEKGISAEEAAAAISDANRYTILFNTEEYVDRVLQVQESLKTQGWEQYDNKWKNYFRSGDGYDGYNTVMVNPEAGQRFELQFHTPESMEIKEKAWEWFSEVRVLPDQQSQRAKELQAMMRESWSDYQKPEGWERLPGVLK